MKENMWHGNLQLKLHTVKLHKVMYISSMFKISIYHIQQLTHLHLVLDSLLEVLAHL